MDNDRQPVARKQQAANSKQQTACYEKVRVGCHRWAAMIVSGQLSLNKQAFVDKRETMLEAACMIGINPWPTQRENQLQVHVRGAVLIWRALNG
jgi:hypothetical protein